MEMFQEVAESQENKEEDKDATATAGLLEKLKVEDGKTEDKAQEVHVAATEEENKASKEPPKTEAEADKNRESGSSP